MIKHMRALAQTVLSGAKAPIISERAFVSALKGGVNRL
jgi:hypothetical protein